MHTSSVFDLLQTALNAVPLDKRLETTISFSTIKENVSRNIEMQYVQAADRVSRLSFFLEWAQHIEHAGDTRPTAHLLTPPAVPAVRLHDPEDMPADLLQKLNGDFANWVIHRIVRDLSEFFNYFLLTVFETCTVVTFSNKDIVPTDIVAGRLASEEFDGAGVRERLATLRRKFKVKTPYVEEIISLNKLRNVMAHYDGIVQAKHGDGSGKFRIKWPVNTYRLKRRDTGKFVDYADVPKPIKGEDYAQIQIKFLIESEIVDYRAGDQIKLTPAQLDALIYFNLNIFTEYQKEIVRFSKEHGVPVRPMSKYMPEMQMVGIVEP